MSNRRRLKFKSANHLAIGTAIKLTAVLAAVMLAALSGILDVDALTISVARVAGDDVDLNTAARAIMIAIAINTVSKAIMASWVGNKRV